MPWGKISLAMLTLLIATAAATSQKKRQTSRRALLMEFPEIEWKEELTDNQSPSYKPLRRMVKALLFGAGLPVNNGFDDLMFEKSNPSGTLARVQLQEQNGKRNAFNEDELISSITRTARKANTSVKNIRIESGAGTVVVRAKLHAIEVNPKNNNDRRNKVDLKRIRKRVIQLAEEGNIPNVHKVEKFSLRRLANNKITGFVELRMDNQENKQKRGSDRRKRQSGTDITTNFQNAVLEAGEGQISGVEAEFAQVDLEGFCNGDDGLCKTDHAVCTDNNVCECDESNYVQIGRNVTYCYEQKNFEEDCMFTEQCSVTQICDERCACNLREVPVVPATGPVICAPVSWLKNECTFPEQCPDTTSCQGGVCRCLPELTEYQNTCVDQILPGTSEEPTYGSSEEPTYGSSEVPMYDPNFPECGTQTFGETTNPFPWLVRIVTTYRSTSEELKTVCAGTLIQQGRVLTAAHCVYGIFDYWGSQFSRASVVLYFGDRNGGSDSAFVDYATVSVHPYYRPNSNDYDVAMLTWVGSTPQLGKDNIWPICLPTPSMGDLSVNGEIVDLVEFTTEENGTLDTKPVTSSYMLADYETCNEEHPFYMLSEEMMCAFSIESKRSASPLMRSGGPLFRTNSEGVYVQVGLVSASAGGEVDTCSGSPDMNVNLKSLIPWIEEELHSVLLS